MQQNPYIIVRSPKSYGIAILLTLLLGPLGLFYASVTGGLIMTFLPLVILIVAIASQSLAWFIGFIASLFIWGIIGWLICIVWAIISVDSYNKKLYAEVQQQHLNLTNNDQNTSYESFNQGLAEEYYDSDSASSPFTNSTTWVMLFISALVLLSIYAYYDKTQKEHRYENGRMIIRDTEIYTEADIKSPTIMSVKSQSVFNQIGETRYFIKVELEDTNLPYAYGYIRKSDVEEKELSE